ncbi:MAG: AAA family ATPase [Coriobacteriia bacterium]
MRLRRVEAVRFGGLEGVSLGDLGDGLTVVVGPNEAGKSTFTALVRHVLYGFPTPGAKEPAYVSDAGKRVGRLVFEGDGGRWVVERTEGPHGGSASVRAMEGAERPGLLDEVRHGVSALAFRVVFGFGLADLPRIFESRGSDDDVLARLYAAGAGLTVSPHDVRAALDKAADEIWAPRATTRTANALHARIRDARAKLRGIEDEAVSLANDIGRLEGLEAQLEGARLARDSAASRREVLAIDLERLRGFEATIAGLEPELLEARRALATLGSEVERLSPDERVLQVATALDALLAESSAVRERLERAVTLESEVESLERRRASAAAALKDGGEGVSVTTDVEAGVESWRERLSRAEALAAASARIAGVASDAGGRVRWVVPAAGWTIAVLGVLGFAAGLATRQPIAEAVGALAAAAGVVFALARPARVSGAGTGVAGDAARRDAEDLERCRDEWRAWLAEHGLARAGEDPSAVIRYLDVLKGVRDLAAQRDDRRAGARREREAAAKWAGRLVETVGAFLPDAAASSETLMLAERAREALRSAREAAEARGIAQERLRAAEDDLAKLEARREAAEREARALIASRGVGSDGLAGLSALASGSADDARRAADAYDILAEERSDLAALLAAERRESTSSELRLEVAGLEERLAEAVREHVVLKVAARLLEAAQERYERERQPEVLRAAAAAFARTTRGRYERLSVPLGGGAIEVFDAAGGAKGAGKWSQGTADQVHLALRIGLLDSLGEVGAALPLLMDDVLVNFDSERALGAAEAVADLATRRQVVMFTCHPATAEIFEQVAPEAVRLQL